MNRKYIYLIIVKLFFFTEVHADIDPLALLNKMQETYQSIEKYHDEGDVLITVTHKGTLIFKRKIYFKTTYQRPSSFVMEWDEIITNGREYKFKIGKKNNIYFLESKKKERKIYGSMNQLLSAATGLSGGVSYIVPALMTEEMINSVVFNVPGISYKYIEEERLEGNDAHVIQMNYDSGFIKKYWINKKSHYLRRIESIDQLGKGKTRIKSINYRK